MKKRVLPITIALLLNLTACHDSSDDHVTSPSPDTRTKKVLVIGVDGLGYNFIKPSNIESSTAVQTPNFNRFAVTTSFSGGYLNTRTQVDTNSGPSWSTILTGTYTDQHLVTANNSQPIANDSMFKHAAEKLGVKTASFASWTPINSGHLSQQMDHIHLRVDGNQKTEDYTDGDEYVLSELLQVLKVPENDLQLLFIHLDNMDAAGHECGWGSCYKKQLPITDNQVGEILDAIEWRENNLQEDWLVLYTSDHGHTFGGGHGGQSSRERTVMIGSNRPQRMNEFFYTPVSDIALTQNKDKDTLMGYPGQTSIVPTALAWLGYQADIHDHLQGISLLDDLGSYKPLALIKEQSDSSATIQINWHVGEQVKQVQLYRNDQLIKTLPADQTQYTDLLQLDEGFTEGTHQVIYSIQADIGGAVSSNTVQFTFFHPVDPMILAQEAIEKISYDNSLGNTQWVGTDQPIFVPSPFEGTNALQIDRTRGYASLPYSPAEEQSFSFSFWLKVNQVSSDPNILSNKDWKSGTNPGFSLVVDDKNRIKFQGGNGVKRFDTPWISITKGEWIHITGVFDKEKQGGKLFINDKFVQALGSGVTSVASPYGVINFAEGGDGKYNLNKTVDFEFSDFLLFERVLTDQEAMSLQNHRQPLAK